MIKSSWKDYFDVTKILLGIVTYLIIDMHQSFKQVVRDVEDLKVMVNKHEYIINLKQGNGNKNTKADRFRFEAVLPNHEKKYNSNDIKHKS